MSIVTVVNSYKHQKTDHDVPIGRGLSSFGNPYPLFKYANDRAVVYALFKRHFLERLPYYDRILTKIIESDNPVNLVCTCAPLQCHGDIYKEYIEFARSCSLSDNRVHLYRKLNNYVSPVLTEGYDHVNVYSKSRLVLGRMLSNFYHSPFKMEQYGRFESVEGFWYWLSTGCKHEHLRKLHGYEAKKAGLVLPRVDFSYFDEMIDLAIEAKLEQNDNIKEELLRNYKPLQHYYYYGEPENATIIRVNSLFVSGIHAFWSEKSDAQPTLIAGSRDVSDLSILSQAIIDSKFKISNVVTGMAKGVDIMGWSWANEHNIPTDMYPVSKKEWQASKGAGHARNARMEPKSKQGILIIKNNSAGSEGMLKLMQAANKPVHLVRI